MAPSSPLFSPLQIPRGRSHWSLRREGYLLRRAKAVTPSQPALPTPDRACLLPFADEALGHERHPLKSQADVGRAGTTNRSPISRSGGLCTHHAVSPLLIHSLPLSGWLEGGKLDSYSSSWKTGHSAASPRAEPRTSSALGSFSQRPHLHSLPLWGWSFCPQDAQTKPLGYVRPLDSFWSYLSPQERPRDHG